MQNFTTFYFSGVILALAIVGLSCLLISIASNYLKSKNKPYNVLAWRKTRRGFHGKNKLSKFKGSIFDRHQNHVKKLVRLKCKANAKF